MAHTSLRDTRSEVKGEDDTTKLPNGSEQKLQRWKEGGGGGGGGGGGEGGGGGGGEGRLAEELVDVI